MEQKISLAFWDKVGAKLPTSFMPFNHFAEQSDMFITCDEFGNFVTKSKRPWILMHLIFPTPSRTATPSRNPVYD